jgi:uncharacterized GH25 family protein
MMKRAMIGAVLVGMAAGAAPVAAHDTWVQAAPTIVRPGDVVHVDLLLGNHGNDHRDFKIAGKLGSLDGVTVDVLGPGGRKTDLVPDMIDLGYAPKEGFWSGRFIPAAVGLHCVAHLREGIRHGARGLKGGKTHVLVAEQLDAIKTPTKEHATPLGHPLELVLETHPVIDCGPGKPIAVRLLHRGQPLPDHRVSFIPRGATLAADFDPEFERTTDAEGRCSYTPREGNLILVVAHLTKPEEKGNGYDKTSYSATLVVNVPQRCSCCDE